ncbi:hypothetical protein [Microbacterium trichothecenolyticum]|uniref:Uncharacterized protein n=1 Tax=Microbacterium trichothecenolyticum TaxID=69370 RepID=A0A0M2HG12_MICTR|nr:hypothetical protein [Microbacterium trichothecenolyticum]KJL45602.1 hypothetical protein RS82_00154 [Microbacterium trichothecenolyticum]
MTRLEPAELTERIVGVPRHPTIHAGRAVSTEERVYILHSSECIDSGIDLRECRFSIALDEGIDMDLWERWQDHPVQLAVLLDGRLAPLSVTR